MGNQATRPHSRSDNATVNGTNSSSLSSKAKRSSKTATTTTGISSASIKMKSTCASSSKTPNIRGTITMTENPLNSSVYDKYEKVQHIADGSSCQIWTVRRKHAGKSVPRGENNNDRDSTRQDQDTSATTNAKDAKGVGINTTTSGTALYVMKVISKSKVDDVFYKEMKNEVSILKQLDHPNIVRIYDLFESSDEMYLVMEHCSGGDLWKRYPYDHDEKQVAMIITKILSAVAFMHQNKVVHRDLKIENVMFENTSPKAEPKVIDFGLSKPYVNTSSSKYKMHCRVGTLQTMSPQVIKGDYTSKADLWSVGCVAYKLLSGINPFDGKSNQEIVNNILEGDYKPMVGKEWDHVSKSAKEFVASLLQYDPEKRKSAVQALNSSWLKKSYPIKDRTPNEQIMDIIRGAVLQSSQHDSTFKKLVNMIVAHNCSNESLSQLRAAFDSMDKNNQGTINYFEFKQALKMCHYTEQQLRDIFRGLDVNGTGVINYTEFLAATLHVRGQVEDELIQQAFDKIDQDNSGYISKENICSIMGSSCSQKDCNDIVNQVLRELDHAGDGKVSYNEFLALFRERATEETPPAINGGSSCCNTSTVTE